MVDKSAIQRLREFIPSIKGISDSNRKGLLSLADSLEREQNERETAAIHALMFYSDRKRYEGANRAAFEGDPYTEHGMPYMQDIHRDGGEIAQLALRVYARR